MADKEIDHKEISLSENEIDVYYLISILWRNKIFILSFTFIISSLSIIYVLTATKYYRSFTTMYPITKEQGGPLKEIAASLGLGVKPEGFYLPDVVSSRRIREKIIMKKYKTLAYEDSVNLIQYWEYDKLQLSKNKIMDAALLRLQNSTTLKEDKETTLITITVVTKERKLSADIVKAYNETITHYLQTEMKTQIQESIIFTNARLVEVVKELEEKEKDLIEFIEKNTKISSAFLTQELSNKRKNISVTQDVEILLKKQLELLKIEEVRSKPVMNILDLPAIYEKHVRPKGRNTVILSTSISFLFAFMLCLIYEKAKTNNVIIKLKNCIGDN